MYTLLEGYGFEQEGLVYYEEYYEVSYFEKGKWKCNYLTINVGEDEEIVGKGFNYLIMLKNGILIKGDSEQFEEMIQDIKLDIKYNKDRKKEETELESNF